MIASCRSKPSAHWLPHDTTKAPGVSTAAQEGAVLMATTSTSTAPDSRSTDQVLVPPSCQKALGNKKHSNKCTLINMQAWCRNDTQTM